MKFVWCLAVCLAAQAAEPSWKPLDFLIGTWEARTQGGSAGASGSGTYEFRLDLRAHVLSRFSSTTGCKGPADYNCEHSDLMYVYPAGQSYKAVYFDNEGHVIQYDVTTPSPQTAVFLSSPDAPGPQFRLVYERKGATMSGKFQMRMPGQPDFRSYLEWSGNRYNDRP
jgi:hypothetical protein